MAWHSTGMPLLGSFPYQWLYGMCCERKIVFLRSLRRWVGPAPLLLTGVKVHAPQK